MQKVRLQHVKVLCKIYVIKTADKQSEILLDWVSLFFFQVLRNFFVEDLHFILEVEYFQR